MLYLWITITHMFCPQSTRPIQSRDGLHKTVIRLLKIKKKRAIQMSLQVVARMHSFYPNAFILSDLRVQRSSATLNLYMVAQTHSCSHQYHSFMVQVLCMGRLQFNLNYHSPYEEKINDGCSKICSKAVLEMVFVVFM